MITYNISLNQELAQLVEKWIKKDRYANRSEFFRQVLRHFFTNQIDNDWVDNEPYKSEITKRIKNLKSGKEKLISIEELDKELGL